MHHGLPKFDLDRYIPYQMTVVAARLSADLSNNYKQKHDVSIAEWRVLLNLGYGGKISVRDIEKRVSLEKSKVSRAVTKLETRGCLTKEVDADDRRLLQLTLTPKGVELLAKLIPIADEFQARLEETLGADYEKLQAALDVLMEDG